MGGLPAGRHFFRGDVGYEQARRGSVWNQRVPERYPEVIVRARDAHDVVAAIRYAKAHGQQVSVRSGGHSWVANHLRDGAVMIDLSRINHARIDADKRLAVVGPGKGGSVLMAELEKHGLFFPGGHCEGVCMGGFLLQGGFGWNSRVLGPACESVVGLDMVTADGEQIHCDADSYADLYWAARGAGPGFFAVVTSFDLKLHPLPAVCASSVYAYPVELADDLFTWARGISGEVDRRIEFQAMTARSVPGLGLDKPAIVFASPAFADSEVEARKALSIFNTCPVLDRALVESPYTPTDMPTWFSLMMSNYRADHRYAADNMWTSASADELLPGIRNIIATMPPHPAHFLWMNWGPSPPRQNMAYSMEDEIYLALYGAWMVADDDDKYGDWARSNMAAMEHLASGIQLADENLGQRPARFASDGVMGRLDELRATYDPEGLFHPWMGRI